MLQVLMEGDLRATVIVVIIGFQVFFSMGFSG